VRGSVPSKRQIDSDSHGNGCSKMTASSCHLDMLCHREDEARENWVG
jgi:hypothetical protein